MNEKQKNNVRDLLRREGISYILHAVISDRGNGYEISTRPDLPERIVRQIVNYGAIIQQMQIGRGDTYIRIL